MTLSGEWRVASGEWRVASGEWRVASGEWRVASGEQQFYITLPTSKLFRLLTSLYSQLVTVFARMYLLAYSL